MTVRWQIGGLRQPARRRAQPRSLAVLLLLVVATIALGTAVHAAIAPRRELRAVVAHASCRPGASLPAARQGLTSPRPPVEGPRDAVAVGVQAGLRARRGNDLANTVGRLHHAGLRYTREDFAWSAIEPQPGVYCWAGSDAWMGVAASRGLEAIAVADSPPAWATGTWNTAPTFGRPLTGYIEFVRQLLGRYGSRGSFWRENPSLPRLPIRFVDVWNEPYESRFWAGRFPDPAGYAQMFKSVVAAARPVDSRARFMLEADTTALLPGGTHAPFLSAMFAAVPELAAYADVVSVHPYARGGAGPRRCTRGKDLLLRRFQTCRIEDIRAILDAHGAHATSIWITEIGWSTAPAGRDEVSETTQASYVHATFDESRTRWAGLVDGIVWYAYSTPERDPRKADDWYGLVHPDGRPKPAFRALEAEVQRIR